MNTKKLKISKRKIPFVSMKTNNKIVRFLRGFGITYWKTGLTAEWTVEMETQLSALHGLDAEEEIAKILAKEIDKEINEAV